MNQCDAMSLIFTPLCIAELPGIGHAAISKEINIMQNSFRRPKALGVLAGLALLSRLALATPPIGYTSQSTRSKIPFNLYTTQWGPSPLFNFVMQTSNDALGYDLIHATNTFSPATADGMPSQSDWHTHTLLVTLT